MLFAALARAVERRLCEFSALGLTNKVRAQQEAEDRVENLEGLREATEQQLSDVLCDVDNAFVQRAHMLQAQQRMHAACALLWLKPLRWSASEC